MSSSNGSRGHKEIKVSAVATLDMINNAVRATETNKLVPAGFKEAGIVPLDPSKMTPVVVEAEEEVAAASDEARREAMEEEAREVVMTPRPAEEPETARRGRPPKHVLHRGLVTQTDIERIERDAAEYAKRAPQRKAKKQRKLAREVAAKAVAHSGGAPAAKMSRAPLATGPKDAMQGNAARVRARRNRKRARVRYDTEVESEDADELQDPVAATRALATIRTTRSGRKHHLTFRFRD